MSIHIKSSAYLLSKYIKVFVAKDEGKSEFIEGRISGLHLYYFPVDSKFH